MDTWTLTEKASLGQRSRYRRDFDTLTANKDLGNFKYVEMKSLRRSEFLLSWEGSEEQWPVFKKAYIIEVLVKHMSTFEIAFSTEALDARLRRARFIP